MRAAAEAQSTIEEAADREKKRDHVKHRDGVVEASSAGAKPLSSATASDAAITSQPQASSSPDKPIPAGASTSMDVESQVIKAVEAFTPNPRCCIWDGQEFPDTTSNLEHMLSAHGFHIPDMDAVINVEGMVNYCAEKVHVGRICLFCDKPFATGEACVDHMLAKGHCRLAWEFEDQVEEFAEFYDFSKGQDVDRGTMEIDSATGELVLTDADGRVHKYGPGREYKTVYRQVQEQSRPANAALMAASNERALQIYRRAGVETSSALVLSTQVRTRLVRAKKEKRNIEQKKQVWELHNSLQQNWLQKHAVAGKNVGAGHGVHG